MKSVNKTRLIVFAGIFTLLSGFVLGNSISEKYEEMNGRFTSDKVIISDAVRMGHTGNASFSEEEVKMLAESLDTEAYTCTARPGIANADIRSGYRSCAVGINGTNSMFIGFYGMQFKKGCFFSNEAEKSGSRVAVIDDALSWELFRTYDSVGKTVEMLGTTFTISGIFRKDDSFLSSLSDDGLPDVYIPARTLLALDPSARIGLIQIKMNKGGSERCDFVRTAIYLLGKDPSNYMITDLTAVHSLIAQEPKLVIFLAGVFTIYLMLRCCLGMLKKLVLELRYLCAEEGFRYAIAKNGRKICLNMAGLAIAMTGAVLIWNAVKFKVYIPPEYIPDELIDTGYYADLIRNRIQNGILYRSYIAPGIELFTYRALLLSELLFLLSVISFFSLVHFGPVYFKLEQTELLNVFLYIGVAFILAAVILPVEAICIKMPVTTDIRGLLVLWTAVYTAAGYFHIKRNESVL